MIGNDWDIVLSTVWNSPNFKRFMNNIKEFPKCATCNMPITKNVINAKHGYTLRNDESRN